jgi:hypothetical protein
MKKIIIGAFAIVFLAFTFLFSSNIQKAENILQKNEAAKCRVLSFEEAYKESEAIFVGEVLSVEKNGDVKVFKFKVEKYWKGKDEKNVEVGVYESTRFQAWFKVGEKYLVYANLDDDGKLQDSARCSRSKEEADASEDLAKLGEGKRPK